MNKEQLIDTFLEMYLVAIERYPREVRPYTQVKDWVLKMAYEKERTKWPQE